MSSRSKEEDQQSKKEADLKSIHAVKFEEECVRVMIKGMVKRLGGQFIFIYIWTSLAHFFLFVLDVFLFKKLQHEILGGFFFSPRKL